MKLLFFAFGIKDFRKYSLHNRHLVSVKVTTVTQEQEPHNLTTSFYVLHNLTTSFYVPHNLTTSFYVTYNLTTSFYVTYNLKTSFYVPYNLKTSFYVPYNPPLVSMCHIFKTSF